MLVRLGARLAEHALALGDVEANHSLERVVLIALLAERTVLVQTVLDVLLQAHRELNVLEHQLLVHLEPCAILARNENGVQCFERKLVIADGDQV